MSWKATALVKPLTHHKDGTPLSAREKLILFVLADSHNEDRGNCAWIGVEKAARQSLTSRSRFIDLLKRLESKGTIRINRREGQSSLYFFPDLDHSTPVRELDPLQGKGVRELDPTRPIAIGPHPSDSYRTQAFIEPSGTTIQPPSRLSHIQIVQTAVEENRRTKEPADQIIRRLKEENAQRRLVRPHPLAEGYPSATWDYEDVET